MSPGRLSGRKTGVQRLLVIRIAADHPSRAHKGQFHKDWKTLYIPPARVAGLVGIFDGSHCEVIAAWLHDVFKDGSPEWILKTDALIDGLPHPPDEQQGIAAIADALIKKNTITGKADRLSDSLDRVLNAHAGQHS